jgi:hypothetical protein
MKIYNLVLKNTLKNQNIFANLNVKGLDTALSEDVYDYIKINKAEFVLENLSLQKGKLIYNKNFGLYKTIWRDIFPSNIGVFIFSYNIKKLIDVYVTGKEALCWIEIFVSGNDGKRIYYIPTFNSKHDVLDLTKTVFHSVDKNYIIIPFFSNSKIVNFAMFCKPCESWFLPSNIYFSQTIIEKMKLLNFDNIKYEEYLRIV